MANKPHQLPKDGKAQAPSAARRSTWPLYLAGIASLAIIVGIVLLSRPGSGASGAGSPMQVTGQPVLALDREQINFGKVPLDRPVKAAFKLTNAGNQPLQILNQPIVEVKQGC